MSLPRPVGRQHDVVYLDARGHQVVLGTAGTGKTVMAIHRAVHLANPEVENSGRVLLVTYNKALSSYLSHLARDHRSNLQIETYFRFARGYLHSLGKMPKWDGIADATLQERKIAEAVVDVKQRYKPGSTFLDRPEKFFFDEIAWIDGSGLYTLDSYLGADRVGRMAPLNGPQRTAVWTIRGRYKELLHASGRPYDWADLPGHVRRELNTDQSPRLYKHVVIDEGQDLSPEAIRSLVDAIPNGGSITLFADYAQQLYGQRISWRSVGLRVQRVEKFEDNYRNTTEIALLALEMARMPFFDDSVDLVAPKAPAAHGDKPTLARFSNEQDEIAAVVELATSSARSLRVAVLCTNREDARRATSGIPGRQALHENGTNWGSDAGVYYGTFYAAKGLEFDLVIMPFCGAENLPRKELTQTFGSDEASRRDARLIYVGVTRAQSELLVTYTGSLTSLLPGPSSSVWNAL